MSDSLTLTAVESVITRMCVGSLSDAIEFCQGKKGVQNAYGWFKADGKTLGVSVIEADAWKARAARLPDCGSPQDLFEPCEHHIHLDLPDTGPDTSNPHWKSWDDHPHLREFRHEALKKVIEWLNRGPDYRVFIHCNGGRSRSVTLACLILMHSAPGMTHHEARQYVESLRSTSLTVNADTRRAITTGDLCPFEVVLRREWDTAFDATLRKEADEQRQRELAEAEWVPPESTEGPPLCSQCNRIQLGPTCRRCAAK